MSKKHKQIQRQEKKERQKASQSQDKSTTISAPTHPLSQGALLQMQQQQGNAFVERYLQRETAVQRTKENTEQANEKKDLKKMATAKKEELAEKVDLQVPVQYKEDMIELNLSDLMNLKKFADEAGVYSQAIEEWGGLGEITVMETEKYGILNLESTKSGVLQLEIDPLFQRSMAAALQAQDPTQKPDFTNLFGPGGVELTATLHYDLEDPELKEADLDIPSELSDGDKILPHPILLLQFEGECGRGILPEPLLLQGAVILQAQLKENAEPETIAPLVILGGGE